VTILLNLLKNYGGYALLLAIGGGWYLYHDHKEIDKGEARVVAAQKAADVKEAAHVAKVTASATATIQDLQRRLAAVLTAPAPVRPPSVVVRMCGYTPVPPDAGNSSPRPESPGDGPPGPGSVVGGGSQEGPDIAPMTEKILSDDKAVIEYLQGYIRTCQTAGLCAKQ
jgi:hypothetical protein